jgi:predicted aspartyl protease
MRRAVLVGLFLTLLGAALPPRALAQIYRYTDERGQNYYVDGLQNVPPQYRATASPMGMRNAPAAPAAAATAESAKAPGATIIKFTPGQGIMVDAKINGNFTTKLLLDTGADRTLVSPRVLTAAGVALTKPVASGSITGATGTDKIDFVVLESLEVGEARVAKLPVGSYELAGSTQGDGLLGRDFLEQFNVQIDSSKGEVRLAPK